MGNGNEVEKLKAVLDLALVINSVHSFGEMFRQVVQRTSRIMEADRTSLYVYDEEKKSLWTLAAEGLSEKIYLPPGKGLAGRCASTGKVLMVEDAYRDPSFDPSWDEKHGYRTRSVFCCPIYSREGRLKGVLQVINKLGGEKFDERDAELARFIAAQLGVAMENYFLLEQLRALLESLVLALVTTIDAKHPLTAGHSERVTEYSLFLARKLGLKNEELEKLKYAALLHDIGKLTIPDTVLTKNGPFTPEEREIMKQHALWTEKILERIRWSRDWEDIPRIAAGHHERLDGSGYPYGLGKEEIPFLSKILAVADVFDALTSKRDYPKYDHQERPAHKERFGIDEAVGILQKMSGQHLDPDLVRTFTENIESLEELYVRLHSRKR